MCPDGSFIPAGGQCTMTPNGGFVGGTPRMAPDGSFVSGGNGRTTMCPDGTFVGGSTCVLTPNGNILGDKNP